MELIFLFAFILIVILFNNLILQNFKNKAIVLRKLKKFSRKNLKILKDKEYGKINGLIEAIGEPLIAPLSGKNCVYYSIMVEEKSIFGRNKWNNIYTYKNNIEYLISDNGNYASIEGEYFKSYLSKSLELNMSTFINPTNTIINFSKLHSIKLSYEFGIYRTLRFKEVILENNEYVSVLGYGKWVNSSELKLDLKYGTILTIQSLNNIPIFLSDDPKTFN